MSILHAPGLQPQRHDLNCSSDSSKNNLIYDKNGRKGQYNSNSNSNPSFTEHTHIHIQYPKTTRTNNYPIQLIQGTTRTPKSTNTPTPTGTSAAKTPHSAHGSLAPPPPNSHRKRTATSSTSTGAVHGLIAPTSSDHSRASNPSSKSPFSTSTSDPTAGSSPAVMAQMKKTPYTDSSI